MTRLAASALAAALVVGAIGVAFAVRPAVPEPFPGVQLGMTEAEVTEALLDHDPGVMAGRLCQGTYGVLAYARHLDRTWQVMAHVTDDRVYQIRLYRSSRKVAKTPGECRAQFRSIAAHYRDLHPGAWAEQAGTGEGLDLVHRITLADGTLLRLQATRRPRARALCTIDISYSAPGAFVSAE